MNKKQLIESVLLLEADKRKVITDKLGLHKDLADWAYNLSKKQHLWIANNAIKMIMDKNSNLNREEAVQFINKKLEETPDKVFIFFNNKFNYIFDWYNNVSQVENINLKQYDYFQAEQLSNHWHKNLKATGKIENEKNKIILKLDNNFYWVDLETTNCTIEAKVMGHCANTNEGTTLLSLRSINSNGVIEPHVTVAYDSENKRTVQIKGKQNQNPSKKYHKYIVDLITNNLPEYHIRTVEHEYDNDSTDFRLGNLEKTSLLKLIKEKPSLLENLDDTEKLLFYINKTINININDINFNEITSEFIYKNIFKQFDTKKLTSLDDIIKGKIINTFFNEYEIDLGDDIDKVTNTVLRSGLIDNITDYNTLYQENDKFYYKIDSEDLVQYFYDDIEHYLDDENVYTYLEYNEWIDVDQIETALDVLTEENIKKLISKVKKFFNIDIPDYNSTKTKYFSKYYNEYIKEIDNDNVVYEEIKYSVSSAYNTSQFYGAKNEVFKTFYDFFNIQNQFNYTSDDKIIVEINEYSFIKLKVFSLIKGSVDLLSFEPSDYYEMDDDTFNNEFEFRIEDLITESKKYILTPQQKNLLVESSAFLTSDDYDKELSQDEYKDMLKIILNLKEKRYYSKDEADDILVSYRFLQKALKFKIEHYLYEMGVSEDEYYEKIELADKIIKQMY